MLQMFFRVPSDGGGEGVWFYFSLSDGSDRVKWNTVRTMRPSLSDCRIILSTPNKHSCAHRKRLIVAVRRGDSFVRGGRRGEDEGSMREIGLGPIH